MPKEEFLRVLGETLPVLTGVEVDKLIDRPELAKDFSFEPVRRYVAQIQRLSAELQRIDLELLPEATLTNLMAATRGAQEAIKNVREFAVRPPSAQAPDNPMQRHAQVTSALANASDQMTTQAAPHLAYLLAHDDSVRERAKVAQDEAQRSLVAANTLSDALKLKDDAAAKILAKIQEASGLTGVGVHAGAFGKAAKTHDSLALRWLLACVVVVGATAFTVWKFALTYQVDRDATGPQVAQYAVSRASTIALLFYGVVFCVRNYRSHRHLAVVNDHRRNALSTFETFVKAATDEATKAKVLEEATRCVFAATTTGYLADDPEPNRIVEVIKSFGGKSD